MLVYRFFKVEWTVCAKYTHGGSVKGMVKSNFRFVKKNGTFQNCKFHKSGRKKVKLFSCQLAVFPRLEEASCPQVDHCRDNCDRG